MYKYCFELPFLHTTPRRMCQHLAEVLISRPHYMVPLESETTPARTLPEVANPRHRTHEASTALVYHPVLRPRGIPRIEGMDHPGIGTFRGIPTRPRPFHRHGQRQSPAAQM